MGGIAFFSVSCYNDGMEHGDFWYSEQTKHTERMNRIAIWAFVYACAVTLGFGTSEWIQDHEAAQPRGSDKNTSQQEQIVD